MPLGTQGSSRPAARREGRSEGGEAWLSEVCALWGRRTASRSLSQRDTCGGNSSGRGRGPCIHSMGASYLGQEWRLQIVLYPG